jgi:hypothetical protein
VRSIARGCATQLDAADDTNNSAGDFSIAPPIQRSNATAPTEAPCTPTTTTTTKKCKKKKHKRHSAQSAKKKKCKKKKKH